MIPRRNLFLCVGAIQMRQQNNTGMGHVRKGNSMLVESAQMRNMGCILYAVLSASSRARVRLFVGH